MAAAVLAETARDVFGDARVEVAERLDDAIDLAVGRAESQAALGGAGVIITGSIVTVGEARHLLNPGPV
jgi:dihydrofolate synthase/folylpolyglutamate synthase